MNDIAKLFINVIQNTKTKSLKNSVWSLNSTFIAIHSLQIDNRGSVGEIFIVNLLQKLGHDVLHTGRTDPQNKQWDLVVDNKHRWEVKTATLGKNGKIFQHENIYKERDYHGIVFLDIVPDILYITFVPKHKIEWSKLHRCKDSTFYKWDFNIDNLVNCEVKTFDNFNVRYSRAIKEIDEHTKFIGNPHKI